MVDSVTEGAQARGAEETPEPAAADCGDKDGQRQAEALSMDVFEVVKWKPVPGRNGLSVEFEVVGKDGREGKLVVETYNLCWRSHECWCMAQVGDDWVPLQRLLLPPKLRQLVEAELLGPGLRNLLVAPAADASFLLPPLGEEDLVKFEAEEVKAGQDWADVSYCADTAFACVMDMFMAGGRKQRERARLLEESLCEFSRLMRMLELALMRIRRQLCGGADADRLAAYAESVGGLRLNVERCCDAVIAEHDLLLNRTAKRKR